MNQKEEFYQGFSLQMSAFFVRLDALKESLSSPEREKYNRIMEQKRKHFIDEHHANPEQVETWFQ